MARCSSLEVDPVTEFWRNAHGRYSRSFPSFTIRNLIFGGVAVDRDIVLVLIVAAVFVAAFVAFLYWRKRQTQRLRERYGDEYDRTVKSVGSQKRAERELESREKRVESFNIRPLTPEDRNRYLEDWRRTQARFVDEPSSAVKEADQLVKDVMTARGYPMADFDQRAADISVNHPRVVGNYRIAREIAIKNRKGAATTEDLRQAVVAYRELFVDLLEEDLPDTKKKQHRIVEKEAYDDPRTKREYRH
jgi:hypothetical protein